MKKRRIVCLLLIAVLILCAGCNRATHTGFVLYKSSPLGFRIEYPDSWSKQVDLKSHSVAFFSPQEGFGDDYRENLAISYEELGDNAFVDLFDKYYASLPSVFAGFTEVEKSEILIDGQPAYKLVFSSKKETKEESASLKLLQYVVQNGERVYFITYSATPGNYDYFEPFIVTMMETFTFKV